MPWTRRDITADSQAAREPRRKFLKTYWRMIGPSGIPFRCALYRTHTGLEVRAERSDDDLLESHSFKAEPAADAFAASLHDALVAKGGFADRGRMTRSAYN